MTCNNWLNAIGLICDIIGVAGLFLFVIPDPHALTAEDRSEDEKITRIGAHSSLGLIIIGFICQISTNIPVALIFSWISSRLMDFLRMWQS